MLSPKGAPGNVFTLAEGNVHALAQGNRALLYEKNMPLGADLFPTYQPLRYADAYLITRPPALFPVMMEQHHIFLKTKQTNSFFRAPMIPGYPTGGVPHSSDTP